MSSRSRLGRPRGESIKRVAIASGEFRFRAVTDLGHDQDGKRKQVKRTFSSAQEASEWLARTRTEIADGDYQHASDITVRQWLDRWLDGRELGHENTRAGYRSDLKPAYDKFGDIPLQELTSSRVTVLKTEMRATGGRDGNGRSPRTIELMLVLLSAALEVAVAEGLIKVNPASSKLVERPKKVRYQGSAWTADHVQDFLAKIAQERYAAAWHLTACGLRRSEILGLRWCDVDMEGGLVSVVQARTPKKGLGVAPISTVTDVPKRSASVRTIPIPPQTLNELRLFRLRQQEERLRLGRALEPTDLIVVNEVGEAIHPDTFSNWFRQMVKKCGLPDIRLHDMRRTAATLLATLYQVQSDSAASYLGHSQRTYHDTYVVGETGHERVMAALTLMQTRQGSRKSS